MIWKERLFFAKINRITQFKDSSMSKEITAVNRFHYVRTIELILFNFLSCGLYSYYLIYKWVEVINEVDEREICDPILAVLISFFTCGVGWIFFVYKIPERASYLARKTGGSSNNKRKNLTPPMDDLAVISLIANLFLLVFSLVLLLTTWGFGHILFYPPYIAYYIWLHFAIQRSVEYLLCVEEPIVNSSLYR